MYIAGPIRTWSEHEIAKLSPPVRQADLSPLGNAFVRNL